MQTVIPGMEAMLETFIYETETMLEQLDEILLDAERSKSLSEEHINNIFRITHTIKGSAAMMEFDGISTLSHAMEDVFYVLRDDPKKLDLVFGELFDLILASSDCLKEEIEKIRDSTEFEPADMTELTETLRNLAKKLKGELVEEEAEQQSDSSSASVDTSGLIKIKVFFEDDCQMENMRAFMLKNQLLTCCDTVLSVPEAPESDSNSSAQIIENGLLLMIKPMSDTSDEAISSIEEFLNIKSYEIIEEEEKSVAEEKPAVSTVTVSASPVPAPVDSPKPQVQQNAVAPKQSSPASKQSLISVKQIKLDQLMDLVGELVTAESMVARNPDLKGLKLDNFSKSIRELRKLTDELQDVVMSIRMIPLSGTFLKMERIVRDMSKRLNKKAELKTFGGDTEIDKTIADLIVDPLMHMIRNSMDHAIESPEERLEAGKPEIGVISLSAKSVGGEIHIYIEDDGRGLNAEKLLAKASKNGILTKPESEYTEKDAFGLIMTAGFSTNTEVTEFSGRGVGMDVVRKNIEQVGGSISIDSKLGRGTTFTIKIPLTLAIVDGMNIAVGEAIFTVPIASIKQCFKITDKSQITQNADGSEMIMIRGECFPVMRLHNTFNFDTDVKDAMDGIFIQVEGNNGSSCLFADMLLGEYQVVVKPFSPFFNKYNLKEKGLSGCSILGDGTISLIIDTNNLLTSN